MKGYAHTRARISISMRECRLLLLLRSTSTKKHERMTKMTIDSMLIALFYQWGSITVIIMSRNQCDDGHSSINIVIYAYRGEERRVRERRL